jgi:hypothetical protein
MSMSFVFFNKTRKISQGNEITKNDYLLVGKRILIFFLIKIQVNDDEKNDSEVK